MLSCSFQNGPKEGRREGLGKKEGTKTADYCRRRRRRRAAGDRVALSSWRSPGGRRISPRKTGHEKGQEGEEERMRRTCHYWPLQRSIKELSEKDR